MQAIEEIVFTDVLTFDLTRLSMWTGHKAAPAAGGNGALNTGQGGLNTGQGALNTGPLRPAWHSINSANITRQVCGFHAIRSMLNQV